MRGYLCLLMTSFLWGTTFVAQMVGMDDIGPFTYGMGRYAVGFFVVLAIWRALAGQRKKAQQLGRWKSGWKYGIGAGCIMFVGSALQQIALLYTTVGKTSFITCLYIILVPLFAKLLGKKIRPENWLGAVIALTGLYCLSIKGEFNLNFGDILAFVGAFFWSFHILFIDRYASRADGVEISASQIGICAILNTIACFWFESFTWQQLVHAAIPILYAAVLSSGVAFTLQIIGQQTAEPAPAAVIMSLESVFGVLGGWLVLGEIMNSTEILGCCLMLAGMLVTQAGLLFKKTRRPIG